MMVYIPVPVTQICEIYDPAPAIWWKLEKLEASPNKYEKELMS
jgi:hypothetical protein